MYVTVNLNLSQNKTPLLPLFFFRAPNRRTMAFDYAFTGGEMEIDDGLGYPKAYAKLCRDRSVGPYSHGPPFTFVPYCLQQQEVREMNLLTLCLFPRKVREM